ncbi:MAG: hypothetical protein IJ445_05440 [Clostridia bacterium]|nr:hypothetical protein [Clostridia bacterium]
MTRLFLEIFNMSVAASYLLLAIVLIRIPLKKAPKWISVLLFGIAAIRLICPLNIESVLSLIPSGETVSPDNITNGSPVINSGIPVIDNTFNPIINETLKPDVGASVNPMQIIAFVASIIWMVGAVALVIYAIVSYLRVKRRVAAAAYVCDNVYRSENISSPFVLGFVKPKIYLPYGLSAETEDYVLAHERAHLTRMDHIWKPAGYLLLMIHWFNPLVWLGYVLFCRDVELACDEKVIKELSRAERADYSEALLMCSIRSRVISACPLAFGESGVKERIKAVLSYKKPAFWVILIGIIVTVVLVVCFLTDPLGMDGLDGMTIADKDSIMYGWEGDYSSDAHASAISKYNSGCKPIEWNSESGILIKTEFDIKDVSVRVFSSVDGSDAETRIHIGNFKAPGVRSDRYVFVDIGWLLRSYEAAQKQNYWAYLVTVTDTDNRVHNYYFKVNYLDLFIPSDKGVMEAIAYDIDKDGKDDICQVVYEIEDFEAHYYMTVRDIDNYNVMKYHKELSGMVAHYFEKTDTGSLIIYKYDGKDTEIPFDKIRYDISISNGEIVLTPVS